MSKKTYTKKSNLNAQKSMGISHNSTSRNFILKRKKPISNIEIKQTKEKESKPIYKGIYIQEILYAILFLLVIIFSLIYFL